MKILVVDDNADNRYMLETLLTANGHLVIAAENGREALARLKKETVDLIISDVLMPKMDGFMFCKACKSKKRLKSIPFIFYSSVYKNKEDEKFALSLGADKYLEKPIDSKELLRIVTDSLKAPKDHAHSRAGIPSETKYIRTYTRRVAETLEIKVQELERANERLSAEIDARKQAETALRKRARDEIFGFLAAAIPVFAGAISSSARDALLAQFGNKFEATVKPRFLEYCQMKDMARGSEDPEKDGAMEVFKSYLDWLSNFYTNMGIEMRYDVLDREGVLELLQCPWTDTNDNNPIFCMICRAMIYRSFVWTDLPGSVRQETSKAGGSKSCLFKINY